MNGFLKNFLILIYLLIFVVLISYFITKNNTIAVQKIIRKCSIIKNEKVSTELFLFKWLQHFSLSIFFEFAVFALFFFFMSS